MKVTPISAEQASENSFEPWPVGDYDFSVYEASEEVSQSSGNEQIKLTLHVFNRSGGKRTVFDYLVNTPGGQWKIRHFAEATGMVRQYEAGEMEPADIISREGRLKLKIKPANGQYAANNAVNDYIAAPETAPRAAPRPAAQRATSAPPSNRFAPAGADIDDDIPF